MWWSFCVLGKWGPRGGFLGRGRPLSCPLQISLRQGMRADPGALAALCEKTDNDIRACVNTLQVGGGVGAAALGGQEGGLSPACLCPVPPWAGPAGAECARCVDHAGWP